jgi:hypothetical protein
MAQISDNKLTKIAIGTSIVALIVAAYAAIGSGRHHQPRGFHDGIQQQDFRRGGEPGGNIRREGPQKQGGFRNGPRDDEGRGPKRDGDRPQPEQKQ